jgi:hypothetical protein
LGTGGVALASTTAIMTASGKLAAITITASTTITDGDLITITEMDVFGEAKAAVVYVLTAAATSIASTNGIQINTSGATGYMSTCATSLAIAINAQTDTMLFATATTTLLEIRAKDAGDVMFKFTATNTSGFTVVSAEAQGMIEITAGMLSVSSNMTHVAINVSNQSAYLTSAILIRGEPSRQMLSQQCAVFTQLI